MKAGEAAAAETAGELETAGQERTVVEAAVAPAVVLSCSTPSHSSSCCQMTGACIGPTAARGLQASYWSATVPTMSGKSLQHQQPGQVLQFWSAVSVIALPSPPASASTRCPCLPFSACW